MFTHGKSSILGACLKRRMMEEVVYLIYQLMDYSRYIFVFIGLLHLELTRQRKKIISAAIVFAIGVMIIYTFFSNMSFLDVVLFGMITFLLFDNKLSVRWLMYIPVERCMEFADETIAILEGILFDFNPLIIANYENITYNIGVVFPSFVVLLFICWKNKQIHKQKELSVHITGKLYILLLVAIQVSVMLMSIVSYIAFSEDKEALLYFMQSITFLVIIVVIVVFLLLFYMYSFFSNQEMQKKLLLLQQKQYELQNEYYRTVYQKSEELRAFRHDYRHHIMYLSQRMSEKNYDEVMSYLLSLEKNGKGLLEHTEIYSGNRVIDAIIQGILNKKENIGIDFVYQGRVRQELGIEDIDLCIVLSNVLENAAEACRDCEVKRITMIIKMYKNNLVMQIDNTYRKELFNNLQTSKKNKEKHGYGIQNVLRVIEKYDGTIEYTRGELFGVTIQLNGL